MCVLVCVTAGGAATGGRSQAEVLGTLRALGHDLERHCDSAVQRLQVRFRVDRFASADGIHMSRPPPTGPIRFAGARAQMLGVSRVSQQQKRWRAYAACASQDRVGQGAAPLPRKQLTRMARAGEVRRGALSCLEVQPSHDAVPPSRLALSVRVRAACAAPWCDVQVPAVVEQFRAEHAALDLGLDLEGHLVHTIRMVAQVRGVCALLGYASVRTLRLTTLRIQICLANRWAGGQLRNAGPGCLAIRVALPSARLQGPVLACGVCLPGVVGRWRRTWWTGCWAAPGTGRRRHLRPASAPTTTVRAGDARARYARGLFNSHN